MVSPSMKREAVGYLKQTHAATTRRACQILQMNRSTWTYFKKDPKDQPIMQKIQAIVDRHPRFGVRRVHALLSRQIKINFKKTRRIYTMMNLQLKKRIKVKKAKVIRIPKPTPMKRLECWSMDFIFDRLTNHRRIKTLTLVDDYSKESPGLFTDRSITGLGVIKFLESLPELPNIIRCDNGAEFTSNVFLQWAQHKNIEIDFIEPGKPTQNAFIETFNGKFRDECLNQHLFINLEEAKNKTESWRKDYNEIRPHSSLNYQTPKEFVQNQQPKLCA
jgi:putative transposase